MVVEFLTFSVEPADLAEWLEVEGEVWSRFLETVPGFIRKEMWVDASAQGAVHAVIWWESREAWRAVTSETVRAVDESMGPWFRPAEATEYSVIRSS